MDKVISNKQVRMLKQWHFLILKCHFVGRHLCKQAVVLSVPFIRSWLYISISIALFYKVKFSKENTNLKFNETYLVIGFRKFQPRKTSFIHQLHLTDVK